MFKDVPSAKTKSPAIAFVAPIRTNSTYFRWFSRLGFKAEKDWLLQRFRNSSLSTPGRKRIVLVGALIADSAIGTVNKQLAPVAPGDLSANADCLFLSAGNAMRAR